MKPPRFKYIAARSAEEAVDNLAGYGGAARLLAGGQSLIPLLNPRIARPDALIDLATCPELAYIRHEGDWLAIGPMTRQSDAEQSSRSGTYAGSWRKPCRSLAARRFETAERSAEPLLMPTVSQNFQASRWPSAPNSWPKAPAASELSKPRTSSLPT